MCTNPLICIPNHWCLPVYYSTHLHTQPFMSINLSTQPSIYLSTQTAVCLNRLSTSSIHLSTPPSDCHSLIHLSIHLSVKQLTCPFKRTASPHPPLRNWPLRCHQVGYESKTLLPPGWLQTCPLPQCSANLESEKSSTSIQVPRINHNDLINIW